MSLQNKYELVVGLEVHIQLNTKTKLFSRDSTLFGKEANTQTNEVSLAHPGSLPVLNKEALEKAIKMGLACNSEIARDFYFDRKHYFYPDSPLGYQITQQNTPICLGGHVSIPSNNEELVIPLDRIHMEADAGKSIHDLNETKSFVDLNRSGMPLLELVTKPALYNIDDVGSFVQEIQRIVRFIDIGDGNMEEGSLRCDANISVRLKGETELGQKVEIKNMNSVRNIKKALEYEFERQTKMCEQGEVIAQESRLFNVDRGVTEGMRDKEEAHDYRFFPDPDLAPVHIEEEVYNKIKSELPKLPFELRRTFIDEFKLNISDALSLSENKSIAELLLRTVDQGISSSDATKWIMGPLKGALNQVEGTELLTTGDNLANLIRLVEDDKVTYKNAVDSVLPEMVKSNKAALLVVNDLGLGVQNDEDELTGIIKTVLENNPNEVEAYKNGKKAIIQLFMGKVMKETRGKADPKKTIKLLQAQLSS